MRLGQKRHGQNGGLRKDAVMCTLTFRAEVLVDLAGTHSSIEALNSRKPPLCQDESSYQGSEETTSPLPLAAIKNWATQNQMTVVYEGGVLGSTSADGGVISVGSTVHIFNSVSSFASGAR